VVWQPDYVTASELADFLRIGDNFDDVQLTHAIAAASRAIDSHCHRQFGKVAAAEERRYTAAWSRQRGRWVVEFDDVQDVTNFNPFVAAGSITVYTREPVNAPQKGKPFTGMVVDPASPVKPSSEAHAVTINADWGWTAVPAAVKEATLLQASRLHSRRDSPYGVAGSPELGSELRLLARVDPDVAVSLTGLIRWWAAA